jgi:hypothetical protein
MTRALFLLSFLTLAEDCAALPENKSRGGGPDHSQVQKTWGE